MKLEFSKSFNHNAYKPSEKPINDIGLRQSMLQLIEKSGIDSSVIENNGDKIVVHGSAEGKIHNIILYAEELGLDMKFTKKTVIEIN